MERNDYLKLAQRANMLPRGTRDFRPNCGARMDIKEK